MKKNVFIGLIALFAIVLTGFATSSDVQKAPPPATIFKVTISGNSLVQSCGDKVKLSFSDGTVLEQNYTGAAVYYFVRQINGYNGTVCASLRTTKGGCDDNIQIMGECHTRLWSAAPTVNNLGVTVYKDEL